MKVLSKKPTDLFVGSLTYTIAEIDKAILSCLPAFPDPKIRDKVKFLVTVWEFAKKRLATK